MKKVIIIGAGAAGMAAAYTLRSRESVDVTLLEASDHAGGRMAGEEFGGFYISTGAKFIAAHYTAAIDMCKRLGLPIHAISSAELGMGIYRKGNLHIANTANLLTGKLFSPRELWQLFKFVRLLRRRKEDFSAHYTRLLDLDTPNSLAGFLAELGYNELYDCFAPVTRAMLLCSPDRIGAMYGMEILWVTASTRYTEFRNPYRGVGALSTALAQTCADNTLFSTPVERVILEGDEKRATGVYTKGGFMKADAVICATTASTAMQLIPGLPDNFRSALKKVSYSSCCHVAFGVCGHPLDRTRHRHAFSMFPDVGDLYFAAHSDSTSLSPATAPPGKSIIHVYAAEDRSEELFSLSDDEIKRLAIQEVRKFAPSIPSEPLFTRIYRWKEAACLPQGGLIAQVHELRQQGFPGVKGLYLAGDYMDLPSVSGAIGSGINAAEDVIRFLSLNQ